VLGTTQASAGVVDCADFSTRSEAHSFFESNGGPRYDPYELDGDGDGLVCEWGVGGGVGSGHSATQEARDDAWGEYYSQDGYEASTSYEEVCTEGRFGDEYCYMVGEGGSSRLMSEHSAQVLKGIFFFGFIGLVLVGWISKLFGDPPVDRGSPFDNKS